MLLTYHRILRMGHCPFSFRSARIQTTRVTAGTLVSGARGSHFDLAIADPHVKTWLPECRRSVDDHSGLQRKSRRMPWADHRIPFETPLGQRPAEMRARFNQRTDVRVPFDQEQWRLAVKHAPQFADGESRFREHGREFLRQRVSRAVVHADLLVERKLSTQIGGRHRREIAAKCKSAPEFAVRTNATYQGSRTEQGCRPIERGMCDADAARAPVGLAPIRQSGDSRPHRSGETERKGRVGRVGHARSIKSIRPA